MHPTVAYFDIGSFDCGPGDSMSALFLSSLSCVRDIGVIKCLAIDSLRVIRKMAPDWIR